MIPFLAMLLETAVSMLMREISVLRRFYTKRDTIVMSMSETPCVRLPCVAVSLPCLGLLTYPPHRVDQGIRAKVGGGKTLTQHTQRLQKEKESARIKMRW